ncbi:uncharacterized protein LOC118646172 isoform X3 [Monomorium pharaonis]|uniref:uncharacterized protein LOC118646172 isoform X3 n=1 Tax=Monomorium pharaonis TaxID=307658 RepID=UPI001746E57F|nr:uncharacterized protein LOC118646172 isoform X3 [Monomorium pharaonis]
MSNPLFSVLGAAAGLPSDFAGLPSDVSGLPRPSGFTLSCRRSPPDRRGLPGSSPRSGTHQEARRTVHAGWHAGTSQDV